MFLSIVIPLYNCENYISRCLDTILESPIPVNDYEIIIINDGSKDRGLEICQRYTKRYAHVKLMSQDNKGASTARNAGLNAALGKYVWFVDADDLIVPSFLGKSYHLLQDGSIEMLCFNYQKLFADYIVNVTEFTQNQRFSGIDFFKGHYSNYIWNKIYKVSALRGKRFLDGTKNIEDMLYNMMTIIDMENVVCVSEFGYQYNNTNVSSTSRNRSLRNLVKLDQDSVAVLSALNEFAIEQSNVEKRIILKENLNFSIAGHLYSLFKYYSPNRLHKRISDYRSMGLYPVKKSYNTKGNLFLLLANNEKIFFNLMKICTKINYIVQ